MLNFFRDLFSDGYRYIGLSAPALSVGSSICKFLGIVVVLKGMPYALLWIPAFLWIVFAYVRRWRTYHNIVDDYAHALSLKKVHVDMTEAFEPHTITLKINNSTNRPIKYEIQNLLLNKEPLSEYEVKGAVISSLGQSNYTITSKPMKNPIDVFWEINYGPPRKPNFRVWKQEISINTSSGKPIINLKSSSDELLNAR